MPVRRDEGNNAREREGQYRSQRLLPVEALEILIAASGQDVHLCSNIGTVMISVPVRVSRDVRHDRFGCSRACRQRFGNPGWGGHGSLASDA